MLHVLRKGHEPKCTRVGVSYQPQNGNSGSEGKSGTIPSMGNGLRTLRLNKRWKIHEAAEALGMSRSGYIKLERGERTLKEDLIKRAARVYDVDPNVVVGDGSSEEADGVPLVGYVSAGRTYYFGTGDGELDRVPAPDGATETTVAVEIRGSSLGALFDQWLIFYDEVRSPVTPDLIGRLCVVGLLDDRVLVKRIRRAKTPGLFHLEANTEDTIFDVEIAWAALVTQMTPR